MEQSEYQSFQAEHKKTKNRRRPLILLPLIILGILILVAPAFIYFFVARPFVVSGNSMTPAFVNGQKFIINVGRALPAHGKIVVVNSPSDHKAYIRRIIAIPGDTIMVKNGNVYLNGYILNESLYLTPGTKTFGGTFLKDGVTLKLPPDEYFVMADNRSSGKDSRDWGFVKTGDIIGTLGKCYSNCSSK